MGRGKRHATTANQAAPKAQAALRAGTDSAAPKVRKHKGHVHGRLDPWVVQACGHPHLERTELEGSLIASVGYDDEKSILEVEFRSGGIYHYQGVPVELYEGFFTAPSVGRYFNDEIKEKYPDTAIHSTEYKETPEYLDFVNKHINIHYIDSTAKLDKVVDEILAQPEAQISIDFETAIDSYSDKTRGALRLVQLGIEAEKGKPFLDSEGKQKRGKQWVIDCFRVDPTRIKEVFGSEQEKLIHYLFFEQDWATGRFGAPIKNIFDSCLAWRGIQCYLTNSLRALDHVYRGENVPRSVRRVLGCTVTNREYLERYRSGEGFGDEGEIDYALGAELSQPQLVAILDPDSGDELDERPMTDLEYESWLDEDVDARGDVTEEENNRVHYGIVPKIADMLDKAKFTVEPLEAAEIATRLQAPLGFADDAFYLDDPELVAEFLIGQAAKNRAQELPKTEKLREPTADMDEDELLQLEAENREIAASNAEVLVERAAIKASIHATPFIMPLEIDGKRVLCAFPDYDLSKRSATSFHPNTLAYVTKKILKFEIPKTEQAGYWGRPTLTSNQVIYSAVDVAVLPQIARETKQVVDDLGIGDEVYRRRIGASEIRVAERVQKKLADGNYVDHFEHSERALLRAVTVDELDNAWHSFRQRALYFPSFKLIDDIYKKRKQELTKPRKSRSRAGASPF